MGQARDLYEHMWVLLERSDWDELMALFTDDVEVIFQDALFNGADPLRAYLQAVMQAMPDLTHEVTDAIENGDGTELAGVVIGRGTHATPDARFGETDITGRVSQFRAIDLMWVRDGKFCKWLAMYDVYERAASLGLQITARDIR